ncbi:MAG: carboxypeptidase-like regulatory domain-containing protein [Acidobacteriota bacterium]
MIWQLLPAAPVDFKLRLPRHAEFPEEPAMITLEPAAMPEESDRGTASEAILQSQLTGPCQPVDGEPSHLAAEERSADFAVVRCRAPVGTYHLRLKVPGFASLFLWNQQLPGSLKALGQFSLIPGSSLVGRAQLEASTDCGQLRCEVEIEPLTFAVLDDREEGAPTLQRSRYAVQPNGFFQLTGLSPGQARLRVRAEGFAPAPPLTVELRPGLETTLLDPVVLRPPVTTPFAVSPTLSPKGRPWTLHLRSLEDRREAPRSAETDVEGSAVFRDLPAGRYRYSVESDSDRWAHGEIELQAGGEPVEIEVPWIFVEGTVTSEDEPVHAKLWFGRRNAPLRHFVDTGDDGTYRIALSRAGLWPVTVELPHLRVRGAPTTFSTRSIEVPWVPPGETTGLDIGLPSGRLVGRVLGPRERIVDCDVNLQRDVLGEFAPSDAAALRPATASARTNPDGEFQLEHLTTGSARITARCPTGSTSTAEVEIVDGETKGPVLLELPLKGGLSGQVVGPLGPVAGARVFVWPRSTEGTPRPTTMEYQRTTDLEGRFQFSPVAGIEGYTLTAMAPGLAARLLEAPISGEISISLNGEGGRLILEMPENQRPWLKHQSSSTPAQVFLLSPSTGGIRERIDPPEIDSGSAADNRSRQRWTIPSLTTGSYEVCFGPKELTNCRSIFITPGSTTTLIY